MRRKLLVSLVLAALLLLSLPGQTSYSYATPSPPYILVNESTHQCYVSIMNDECFSCEPPAGWKVQGTGNMSYGPTDCPAGYSKIDDLALNCTRYKSRECCGTFSAHGDCEDMVVNATQQACAFVDDIRACRLPQGWTARPTEVLEINWGCNFNGTYHWVDNVSCVPGAPIPAAVADIPIQHPAVLPMMGIALILLGGGLAWLRRRRVK